MCENKRLGKNLGETCRSRRVPAKRKKKFGRLMYVRRPQAEKRQSEGRKGEGLAPDAARSEGDSKNRRRLTAGQCNIWDFVARTIILTGQGENKDKCARLHRIMVGGRGIGTGGGGAKFCGHFSIALEGGQRGYVWHSLHGSLSVDNTAQQEGPDEKSIRFGGNGKKNKP